MIAEPPLSLPSRRTVTRRLIANRSAVAAIALLLAIVIPCVAAPMFAPYDPLAQPNIALKSQPPSAAHPFGTDPFSRDVFSRVLYGGRLSLTVALIATLVSITLGTAYGAVAGFAGGVVESAMMRIHSSKRSDAGHRRGGTGGGTRHSARGGAFVSRGRGSDS